MKATALREEEIVLLYALVMSGQRPSGARAKRFIIANHLLTERRTDHRLYSGGESGAEKRITSTRNSLSDKKQLSTEETGVWGITAEGICRLEHVAIWSTTLEQPDDEQGTLLLGIPWAKFSEEFLTRLKMLGQGLVERNKEMEQRAGPASESPPSTTN